MQPGSIAQHPALLPQIFQQPLPQRLGGGRQGHAAQAGAVGARLVRRALVEGRQRLLHPCPQRFPVRGQDQRARALRRARLDPDRPLGRRQVAHRPACQALQRRFVQAQRGLRQQRLQPAAIQHVRHALQPLHPRRRAALAVRRVRIEHPAAAHGARGLGVAHDVSVARHRAHRLIEHQLHPARLARGQRVGRQRHHVRHLPRRADVHVQRRPGSQRRIGRRQQRQGHIDVARRQEAARIGDPVAARDRALVDPRQVQGAALAGRAGLAGLVLRVDAAYPHPRARRHQAQVGIVVAGARAAAMRGAGHHGAVAGQGENAVHRQPEQAGAIARAQRLRDPVQMLLEPRHACVAGARRAYLEQGRVLQKRIRRQCRDLAAHRRQPGGVGAIGLGQRHRPARHAQQRQDRQMFAGLRHDAVIGRHHQQAEVDAAGAGSHGMHQLFVARHVDEAQHVAVGQGRVGVAQLDRDAARLLFLEAVGIDARQRPYQRGLAMVDMAGGADDHARGSVDCAASPASCSVKAASSRASRQRRSSHSASSAMRPITGTGMWRKRVSSRSRWRPGRPLPR
ncbi:Uncharacterised protein [Achromobacter xylosoxidans]|nr:Uncharacterised protein [Achromobacter xylosoxidans]